MIYNNKKMTLWGVGGGARIKESNPRTNLPNPGKGRQANFVYQEVLAPFLVMCREWGLWCAFVLESHYLSFLCVCDFKNK